MLRDSGDLVPSGFREQSNAYILRLALRTCVKLVLAPCVPLVWQRVWIKQAARLTCTAAGVQAHPDIVGAVPGEWLRPSAASERATILYLHGGGYCVCAPKQHRAITSHLARAAGLPVFAPRYRLAPEHPFPAAIDDAVRVYEAVRARGPVILAGDSAGGGLALATALIARDRKIGVPAALILFSPWVDLTLSKTQPGKADPLLSTAWAATSARYYLAGKDAASPLASPLFADLRGLPPALIQTGSDDLLLNDATRLHEALVRAGVDVICEIVPSRWHVFQFHAGVLPSATAAIERAGTFAASNAR